MNMMCINIINSDSPWHEAHSHNKDALLDKAWIKWFLNRWGFPAELSECENTFELLDGLRSLLSGAVDILLAGEELPQESIIKMNRYMAGSAMHYEIKAKDRQYQLSLSPEKSDWNHVLSEITASFARLISESDTTRLKRCKNPDCRSVFLDGSKNKARKWCCNTCSSLIKVRRHRERIKNAL